MTQIGIQRYAFVKEWQRYQLCLSHPVSLILPPKCTHQITNLFNIIRAFPFSSGLHLWIVPGQKTNMTMGKSPYFLILQKMHLHSWLVFQPTIVILRGTSLSVDLGGSCTEASFGDETDAGLGWFCWQPDLCVLFLFFLGGRGVGWCCCCTLSISGHSLR